MITLCIKAELNISLHLSGFDCVGKLASAFRYPVFLLFFIHLQSKFRKMVSAFQLIGDRIIFIRSYINCAF